MITISMSVLVLDVYSFKHSCDMQYLVMLLFLAYAIMVIYDALIILWACFLLFRRSISDKTEEEMAKFRLEKKWFWMHASTVILMSITFPFAIISWQAKIYASFNTSTIIDVIKLLTALNFCVVFVMRNSIQARLKNQCYCVKEKLKTKFKRFYW